MGKKVLIITVAIASVVLMFFEVTAIIRWNNFRGINDKTVLPFLKHLPYDSEGGNISASDGRLLYNLIIRKGYKRGLELGTSNGYSALWQALAFKETNGLLVTVEIDTLVALEAKRNFDKAGLDKFIDSRINDASVEVLAFKDSLDFVFIDTGPKNLDYLNISYPLVERGGILVVHNVHKNDDQLKMILSNPDLKTTLKSRFFYSILICEKKQ